MFKRILVPIDVSDPDVAQGSVAEAIELAKLMGSEVRLVAVVNPIVPVTPMDVVPQTYYETLGDFEKTELEKIAAAIDLPKDRVSIEVRDGGTYPELLEAATDWNADLIIIGAHKRSMATFLLGSTASAVVRHATAAVLVLRSDKKAHIL
jgi:nucleotide-binding universal stress UspA family protein